jgi:type I restriction enzyme, S subunit
VNRNDVHRAIVPCPPVPEQRRIAAILDKADAVRRKRQEALRLTGKLLRSIFLDMFGDPVTNPRNWEIQPLADNLAFLTSGSRGWAQYYSDDGELFLRIQNVGRNELILDDVAYVHAPATAEAKRTRVLPGDVLLSITADLGRTAVIPSELGSAYINQHLAILRLRNLDPVYVSAFLASEGGQTQIQRLNRGGVKAGLNFDDIRSLQIPIPPNELQMTFARALRKSSAHRQDCVQAASGLDELFEALVQRAFRGEL